jgi:RNA polymerase sigma-70 factor, ECF subfamily
LNPRVLLSSFIRPLFQERFVIFSRGAIRQSPVLVCKGDGMSRPATHACAQPISDAPVQPTSGELLLRTFTDLRDELVSTLCFLLGNAEDAQDVAQEAFLRCWRTQEGLADIQNLRAWIFRVGLNAAKDLQRSAWRRRVKPLLGADAMPMPESPSPLSGLENQETLQRLRQALLHLRPEEKEVFLLRQNGELTYEQIAELSERPVGTVKTQMRAALRKIRLAMGPRSEDRG